MINSRQFLALLLAITLVFLPMRTVMADMDLQVYSDQASIDEHDCCEDVGANCKQSCGVCVLASCINTNQVLLLVSITTHVGPVVNFDEHFPRRNPAPLLRPPASLYS